LLEEQAKYYGLDMSAVKQYQNATLDSERETLKNNFRKAINNRISKWEKEGNKDWLTEVERFMVKTQSLRQRFGQLTLRMKSNIGKYQELITQFSNNDAFADEFRTKLRELQSSIDQVDSNFNAVFNPSKYIEDSAVMYITQ